MKCHQYDGTREDGPLATKSIFLLQNVKNFETRIILHVYTTTNDNKCLSLSVLILISTQESWCYATGYFYKCMLRNTYHDSLGMVGSDQCDGLAPTSAWQIKIHVYVSRFSSEWMNGEDINIFHVKSMIAIWGARELYPLKTSHYGTMNM